MGKNRKYDVKLSLKLGLPVGTLSKEVGDDVTYYDRQVVDSWPYRHHGFLACLGGVIGNPDQGDHAAMVAAVSQNVEITKWQLGLAALFMFFLVAGLARVRNSMAGGPGSFYAAMGVLIVIMSSAFGLGEIALTIVAGDVGSAGNSAVATAIYLAGNGIGAISTAGIFLGFLTLGFGVYIQKNYNTIIACLLTASGLFGLVMALYDYGSQLITIGFIGMSISVVLMGVSTLRSAD